MKLDPSIWLPHYKFILITMALYYPQFPNDVTKKKYYDFIQNIPLFIPEAPLGDNFVKILDEFPITPYLDSRLSFLKWVNFIGNKLNGCMDLPHEELYECLENYYNNYKPKEIVEKEQSEKRKKYINFSIFILILGSSIYLYTKKN